MNNWSAPICLPLTNHDILLNSSYNFYLYSRSLNRLYATRPKGPFLESRQLSGPGKLFYVCIQDQRFNNFENDTMKLSVNEAKLTGLWAQQVLILKFVLGTEKLTDVSTNGPQGTKKVLTKNLLFSFVCFSLCAVVCWPIWPQAHLHPMSFSVEGYVVPPSESSKGTKGYAGVSILLLSFLINIP